MSNAAGALEGIKALEREAEAAHRRVADALEGARVLLHGAIVERYGKEYQITTLRAYRGIIHAYGVRFQYGRARIRDLDLGNFRDCKIIKYPEHGDTNSTVAKIEPIPKSPNGSIQTL